MLQKSQFLLCHKVTLSFFKTNICTIFVVLKEMTFFFQKSKKETNKNFSSSFENALMEIMDRARSDPRSNYA